MSIVQKVIFLATQANFPLVAAKLEHIEVKFGQVTYFAFTKTLES